MFVHPFTPTSDRDDVSATTANAATELRSAPVSMQTVCRVVNEGTTTALVTFGGSSANALTDTKAVAILGGTEKVLVFPPTATYAAVALRSGTGTVSFQLGMGS